MNTGGARHGRPRDPRRHRPFTSLFAAALALGLTAAVTACSTGQENPRIVVTTNILGDVVRNVVGESAEVTVLMKPNADPHSFGISAKEAGEMESADLIVSNGLGLEEGLNANLDNARSEGVEVLEIGEQIDPLDYRSGENVGQSDPHFWTDPERMLTAVDAIEDALAEQVESEVAAAVADSADTYRDQLKDLDAEIADIAEAIPADRRKLVTNHHVFGYFADRFDFEVIGAVLPSGTTLASPSAADLEELARTVEQAGVSTIFADSSQPQKLAEALSGEVDAEVEVVPLFSESLTEDGEGAATYIDMQKTNAESIAAGLAPEQ